MTKEELFRAVGEVREDQITEAENMKKQSRSWRRYGALAACLAVVLAGVLSLERLEDARKWAEIEESFQTVADPESILDAGGAGDPDGTEYWTESGKRPASNYSVHAEIGEIEETGAAKRTESGSAEDRMESAMASDSVWLSPEEIFAQDTAIFRGTVRALRYYVVETDGYETQYTAADVEVTDPMRGGLAAGEIRTVLYPGGPDMTTSISGPLDDLEVGSDAILMPVAATPETGRREGDSFFCYADLGEFYLSEGMRYVFLDTGDGLAFDRGTYADIADAETLDEAADYVREMIGGAERMRPAVVPVQPQPDPALLDPGYGTEGPAGAREIPDGTGTAEKSFP